MSRELKDFVAAFSAGLNIVQKGQESAARRDYYKARTPPRNPAMDAFMKKYGARLFGAAGAAPGIPQVPQPFVGQAATPVSDNVQAAPMSGQFTAPPSSAAYGDDGMTAGQPDYGTGVGGPDDENYRRGGKIARAVPTYASGGDVLTEQQRQWLMENSPQPQPVAAEQDGAAASWPPVRQPAAPGDQTRNLGNDVLPPADAAPALPPGLPQGAPPQGAPPQGAPPQQAVPTIASGALPAYDPKMVPGVGMGDVPARNAQHQTQGEEREAGETVPAKGGGGGAGITQPGKRKGLTDQTRTEAFDEEKDKDDPDNRIKDMIHGGLMFAQHVFHLDGSGAAVGMDPHMPGGVHALITGRGAASPEEMQAVGQIVRQQNPTENFDGPDGTAKLTLKGMDIAYRWAMMNGDTPKANKMAFEMMQYAVGEAAKLGTVAVQAIHQGNIPQAVQATLGAYNQLPDGLHYAVGPDGKSVVVTNVNNGQVMETVPYTPQMLYNAALGLSNRSGAWNALMQRVVMTTKGATKEKDPTKEALDQARIRLTNARADNVGKGRGRAAAAGTTGSTVISDMLSRLGGGSNSSAPTFAGGGDVQDPEQVPEPVAVPAMGALSDAEGGGGEGGDGQSGSPPRPVGAPDRVIPSVLRTDASRVIPSVLRTSPAAAPPTPGDQPTQVTDRPAPGAPSGTPTPGTPAQEAEEGGPTHPMDQFKDKVKDPTKNPYGQMLRGIDPTTGKPSPELLQAITGKANASNRQMIDKARIELDAQIKEWKKTSESRRKDIAGAAAKTKAEAAAADRLELKQAHGVDMNPAQSEKMETDLTTELGTRLAPQTDDAGKPLPPTIFNDKSAHKPLRDLTMGFLQVNKNYGPQRGLDVMGELTRAGTTPDDKDLRAYSVVGKDALGNVMLKMNDTGDQYRLPAETFNKLDRFVQDRWQKNVKAAAPANANSGMVDQGLTAAGQAIRAIPEAATNYWKNDGLSKTLRGVNINPMGAEAGEALKRGYEYLRDRKRAVP